ncbi:NAD-dependent epimerase/dehydratase family protein [Actinocrispum sp. NPDC049592]|uniref:NAD-dependent epimerase/dehydratase family protein n=1 Tax=Actinocrispum sp. NPDC049592 TaxID=3154835 RepID=UPI003425E26A
MSAVLYDELVRVPQQRSMPASQFVVGGGGLLGRHVCEVLGGRLSERVRIDWPDHARAGEQLSSLGRFLAAQQGNWNLYWCAGLAVFHTGADQVERERRQLSRLLAGIGDGGGPSKGAIFFASSAGGAYAGSDTAPFTEFSPAVPVNPYGEAKLRLEEELSALARSRGLPAVAARITNLYGPGQNLTKNQGLVSAIVKAQLTGEPLPLRAPLETTRDYIYARDCARMAVAAVEAARVRTAGGDPYVCKIFASGRPFRIEGLLTMAERLFDRPVSIVHEDAPGAANVDLTAESRVWTDLGSSPFLGIEEGMRAVRADLRHRLALG